MKRVLEEGYDAFEISWQFQFHAKDKETVLVGYPCLAKPQHGSFFQAPASIFQAEVLLKTPAQEKLVETPYEVRVLMLSKPPADCDHFPDGNYRLEQIAPGVFVGFPDWREARETAKKREKKIAKKLKKKLANKKRWGSYVKDDDNADATTPPVVNEPAKTETPTFA